MGKKKKNNKNEQRQISQPPTDTSETTMPEPSDAINGIELLAEIGNSFQQISTMNYALPSPQRPLALIGWGAMPEQHTLKMNYDINLARLCKSVGVDGYNYMAFPMGGLDRAAFKLSEDSTTPPPINIPDAQFDQYLWQTYIIGTISPWIDTDNPNPVLAKVSVDALRKELDHALYLGVRNVVVPLKRVKSPNLMKLLNHYLWVRTAKFTISLVMPTRREEFEDHADLEDEDIFNLWVTIRRGLRNYTSERLTVGLRLTEVEMDDEFLIPERYDRWHGEPLFLFILSTDSFVFSPSPPSLNSKMVEMVPAHRKIVFDLAISLENQKFLVMPKGQMWPTQRKQMVEYLTSFLNQKKGPLLPPQNDDRVLTDVLLLPMETVWSDLSAADYDGLESDITKYQHYSEAIGYMIGNEIDLKNGLVIYILGAGRGGLVGPCLEIVKARFPHLHKIVTLIAVEKNPSACISLRYKNNTLWHGKLRIIEGDMRFVLKDPDLPKADLIISELLGSFGDNELAPECLKGAEHICTPSTQFIPYQYSSLLSPICSHRATDQLRDSFVSIYDSERAINVRFDRETGKFIYSRPKHWTDHLYVSLLNRYHEAARPQEVSQFKYSQEDQSFERHVKLSYTIKHPCEITGFLGHFVAVLASDIYISNSTRYPGASSACLKSWFPCYLPLREEIRVKGDSELILYFWRKCCEDGAWYEWNVTYTEYGTNEEKTTPLQNENADSYFMPLCPKEEEIKELF